MPGTTVSHDPSSVDHSRHLFSKGFSWDLTWVRTSSSRSYSIYSLLCCPSAHMPSAPQKTVASWSEVNILAYLCTPFTIYGTRMPSAWGQVLPSLPCWHSGPGVSWVSPEPPPLPVDPSESSPPEPPPWVPWRFQPPVRHDGDTATPFGSELWGWHKPPTDTSQHTSLWYSPSPTNTQYSDGSTPPNMPPPRVPLPDIDGNYQVVTLFSPWQL